MGQFSKSKFFCVPGHGEMVIYYIVQQPRRSIDDNVEPWLPTSRRNFK